ncbi:hypothetical protein TI39_contig4254g00001 [Zymoseptoria brevis]|uniref:Uncharacterized protein n=1 Tax=Zymoseptoria brevis TaxID=1047168 RepID=A0A0F4GC56_9PEZI|nr:hypothetical protein TI39_contig4254g00001 [Zymoseptoria brevis]
MSVGDILAVVTILIDVGKNLHDRINAMKQADNDLLLLTIHLKVLSDLFEGSETDVVMVNSSEFMRMLGILKSIQESYNKCAKVLGVEPPGMTSATQKTTTNGKSITRRVVLFARIPSILAEIREKADQLQKITTMMSFSVLLDVRKHHGDSGVKESLESTIAKTTTLAGNFLDPNVRTGFTNLDRMVEYLMEECKRLARQLQEFTLVPDASVIHGYQAQNPEGASFWKDRFQGGKLDASAFRYETFYVSWARFVHEVETSFVLKKMPTGIAGTGSIDYLRLQGSCHFVDQSGIRQLSTIRPLWLPALRSKLDPLHKGYVKPEDYFRLIHEQSLSDTLRRLVFESAGYGTLIECARASGDLALPAAIESPSAHIGWVSAEIVAVPTPADLGIVTVRDNTDSCSGAISAYLDGAAGDVHVYVRYVQTGQIERKSLSKQIRPVKGLSIGGTLCIRHELDSDDLVWSCDLRITELKACQGGAYIITACDDSTSIEFRTRPLKTLSGSVPHSNDDSLGTAVPDFDYMLLGPSKTFTCPPKVGEKIQIEYDGHWYDSRVTVVDGDEIEFVDWETSATKSGPNNTRASHSGGPNETDDDSLFFPEEQLAQLGKGTRRLWRPWRRNVHKYDVRPYRRFHIGDTIEAPVMYPDFRYHYHDIKDSQLYLPGRIVDVEGDQYAVEFSPAFTVHSWWPGRMSRGEEVDSVPGSDIKLKNPFDFNRVDVAMDLVRPFIEGPRPALGVQSAKPSGWSSFQGIHLCELEDLWERSLWNKDRDAEGAGG